jgi:predicted nucleic acid-binding protein
VNAPVFVDTSAWYALADASHPDHAGMADSLRALVHRSSRIVTTNLVLAETHALLLRRANREAALELVRRVRQPPNVIEYSSIDREEEALSAWIARFSDQRFSLTDAVSFVVMKELGIREALTLDRHFAAAGFTMLPR